MTSRWQTAPPTRALVLALLLAAAALLRLYEAHVESTRGQGGDATRCSIDADFDGVVRVRAVTAAVAGLQRVHITIEPPAQYAQPVVPDCHAGLSLRLSWAVVHGVPLPGETWRVQAKTSSRWGHANPGGFDYALWLKSQGLHGSGYVRRADRLVAAPGSKLARLRQRVERHLLSAQTRHAGVLRALALGDGTQVPPSLWFELRSAGAVHLLVVSGLHLAVLATGAYGLGWLVATLVMLVRRRTFERWPRRWWGRAAGVAAASLYLVLTGASVPVLRAWLMLLTGCVLFFTSRRVSGWLVWTFAVGAVVVVDPLAVFAQGFWLSFGAVLLLIALFQHRRCAPRRLLWLRQGWRAQWGLWVGLSPLVAFWTGHAAISAPVANLVLVPLVGIAVVWPLLTAVVLQLMTPFDGLARRLLQVADLGVTSVVDLLDVLNRVPAWALAPPAPDVLALSVCGAGMLILPVPARVRLLGLVAWLLLWTPAWPRLPAGVFRISVLDVGQSSAALVETRSHTLVFDAGARFPSGFDLGQAVVLPAVASLPQRRVDTLVVSHADIDHAGGLSALAERFPDAVTYRDRAQTQVRNCHDGWRWQQDGVSFRFLSSPWARAATADNDRSCVLLVEANGRRALLTGDTSSRLEMLALRGEFASEFRGNAQEKAHGVDLLVAPHHGSNTSSSLAYVRKLRPRHVIASVARRNRYGHPHPAVVARYAMLGTNVVTTACAGAVIWRSDREQHLRTLRPTCLTAGASNASQSGA